MLLYNMIGIGWATLYASLIETYEKKSNIKIQSQTYNRMSVNNMNE